MVMVNLSMVRKRWLILMGCVWKQLDGELGDGEFDDGELGDGEVDGDGEPVDGEEEVIDADCNGIPLRCVETARTKPFSCFFKVIDLPSKSWPSSLSC